MKSKIDMLTIASNKKTKLISKLQTQYEIQYYKRQTFFDKLLFKKDIHIDLYFLNTFISQQTVEELKKSSLIVCNSKGIKKELQNKVPNIKENHIEVIYPYSIVKYQYNESIKNDFKKKYNIQQENKVIFFTAKDMQKAGIKSFIHIISHLENKNFEVLIESGIKQIEKLKRALGRKKIDAKIHFLTDYPDKELLFMVSDIYIAPTIQKPFSQNILIAMHYHNAVLIPQTNFAAEILDPFAIMNTPDDPSTIFKVDALLSNEDELKSVQGKNFQISKEFSFENRFEKIVQIIEKLNKV